MVIVRILTKQKYFLFVVIIIKKKKKRKLSKMTKIFTYKTFFNILSVVFFFLWYGNGENVRSSSLFHKIDVAKEK